MASDTRMPEIRFPMKNFSGFNFLVLLLWRAAWYSDQGSGWSKNAGLVSWHRVSQWKHPDEDWVHDSQRAKQYHNGTA